jgi:hypothetical protein
MSEMYLTHVVPRGVDEGAWATMGFVTRNGNGGYYVGTEHAPLTRISQETLNFALALERPFPMKKTELVWVAPDGAVYLGSADTPDGGMLIGKIDYGKLTQQLP